MRIGLDEVNGDKPNPQMNKKISESSQKRYKGREFEERNYKYEPSNTFQDTKNILK